MKLFRKIPCQTCNGKRYISDGLYPKNDRQWKTCKACHASGEELEEVDPADLELGYYGLVQDLKERFGIPEEDEAKDTFSSAFILRLIKVLESGLDPGKIRKIREKARTWRWFFEAGNVLCEEPNASPVIRELVQALRGIEEQAKTTPDCDKEKMVRVLRAIAQAELEAEGKEKGDSHDQ